MAGTPPGGTTVTGPGRADRSRPADHGGTEDRQHAGRRYWHRGPNGWRGGGWRGRNGWRAGGPGGLAGNTQVSSALVKLLEQDAGCLQVGGGN